MALTDNAFELQTPPDRYQGAFDPFRTPPGAALKEAKARFCVPGGLCGRAGCLVFEKSGKLYALFQTRAISEIMLTNPLMLTESELWPQKSITEVKEAFLTDALGKPFSFREFLLSELARYPQKDFHHGGKEIAWRKGQMLFAMSNALDSPSVQLLNAFYTQRKTERLVALTEWQCGESPVHEMRIDGAFYPPLSSGKELVMRLMQGEKVLPYEKTPETDAGAINVLYEDAALLVVDKPSGLASVASLTEKTDALTLLTPLYGALFDVHRLDMATSGVIVYAKNKTVQAKMHKAFRGRDVHKTYEALLDSETVSEKGRIELPIGVDRLDRPRQCVVGEQAGGRICITDFERIGLERLDGNPVTRVLLYPQTGRTHQLRVHCAHHLGLHAPICGDAFYGKRALENEAREIRLMLHAREIRFIHPETERPLVIVAKTPF